MGEQHSIAEARSNLPDLIKKAEAGTAVELTRRGEPVAVLIGRSSTSASRRRRDTSPKHGMTSQARPSWTPWTSTPMKCSPMCAFAPLDFLRTATALGTTPLIRHPDERL